MEPHPNASPLAPLPSPTQRRLSSGERRRQLIRDAVGLFSRHGFSGARTKDIASACGVSEAILFRHFATKEDLYRAILDEQQQDSGAEAWLEEMRALAARRDDEALVRCLIAQVLKSFRENTPFHRLLLFAWLDGHALADLFHQRQGWPTFEFLRDYFEQRQKERVFRKCDPAAAVLFLISVAVHYAMSKHLFDLGLPASDEEVADQFATFVLEGIKTPPSRRRGARK
jgi:TetR/AcrR family transcriptional regulator